MDRSTPSLLSIYLPFFILIIAWGTNFATLKVPLEGHFTPLGMNTIRFIALIVTLYLILRLTKEKVSPIPQKKIRFFIVVLCNVTIYQFFFIFGLYFTTTGNASIIYSLEPFIIAIIATILGYEKLNLKAWIGILGAILCVSSMVIFTPRNNPHQIDNGFLGELCMLGAVSILSIGVVLSRSIMKHFTSQQFNFSMCLYGGIPVILAGIPDLIKTEWIYISLYEVTCVIYSGIVIVGIGQWVLFRTIRYIGATKTSNLGNVSTAITIIYGIIMLNEPSHPIQIVTFPILIVFVYWTQKQSIILTEH